MAATDTYQFPVKGVINRVYGSIVAYSTANNITGGLTTLAATISKDGGAFVSTTNAPVEITGATGDFYLDLTATECNCTSCLVKVTCANSGAVYARFWLVFAEVSILETYQNLSKIIFNKQEKSGDVVTTYEDDDTTVAFSQQFTVSTQTGTFLRSHIY
jgi:hypothetical protein